ncbi:MAG: AAA family ATPase [Planctomycetota bacterium]
MKLQRIRVRQYGKLVDFESDDLADFTVLHGHNEAGKSTLFRLLGTLLFGFSPTDPSKHPDAPWSGGELAGEADVVLDDGTEVRLTRRLHNKPSGGFEVDGHFKELHNRPLPVVAPIGRKVFDSIYALTLQRLRQIDARMWEGVLEQLLTGFGASDLGSVRDAIELLERDANRLWRPDRRGKPRATAVKERLSELRKQRGGAHQRETEQRNLHEERTRLSQEISVAETTLQTTRAQLQRLQRLVPFAPRFVQLEELERDSRDAGTIPATPTDPQIRWDEINEEWEGLHAQVERREQRLQRLAEATQEYDDKAREWLDHRDEVMAAENALQEILALQRDEERRADEATNARRELQAASGDLWPGANEAPPDDEQEQLATLDLTTLATALKEEQDATAQALELRQRLREVDALVQRDGTGSPPLALWICGIGTLAFGLLYAFLEHDVLGGFALMLVVSSVVMFGRWQRERRRVHPDNNPRQRRDDLHGVLRDAEAKLKSCQSIVATTLGPLARPEPPSIPVLQRVQGLLREVARADGNAQAAQERLAACHEAIRTRLTPLDCVPEGAEAEATLALIRGRLRDADERRVRAEVAADERRHTEDELEQLQTKLSQLGEVRGDLESTFIEFGSGDLERGLRTVTMKWASDRRARQLADDLKAECVDYEAIRAEVLAAHAADEEWVTDPRAVARLQQQSDHEEQQLAQYRQRSREAEIQLTASLQEESLVSLEARIAVGEEHLRELEQSRDRKMLLAKVLREAERRFRASHQDDILQRASDYLHRITDGRYDRILASAGDAGQGPGLLLFDPATRREIPIAEPLSQGARDQVFFALRLAIADHLDHDTERLPLLVDESFVNWDLDRRQRGVELLREIATRRQVLFFTFDPASHGLEDEHIVEVTANSGEFTA